MGKLIPFVVNIRNGQFLEFPETVTIECGKLQNYGWMQLYQYSDQVVYRPVEVKEVCINGVQWPIVCNTSAVSVMAFTINYGGQMLANKTFTPDSFKNYIQASCCQSCGCDNECYFEINGCYLLLNGHRTLYN